MRKSSQRFDCQGTKRWLIQHCEIIAYFIKGVKGVRENKGNQGR